MSYRYGYTWGPVHISPRHQWRYLWHSRQWFGVFRNHPGYTGRWGFRVLGFELGRRG